MRKLATILVALLLTFLASPSLAGVHGRIELQGLHADDGSDSIGSFLGQQTRNDFLGDLRVNWSPSWDEWTFSAQYRIGFDAGDTPAYARKLDALGLFPSPPPPTLFDLTGRIVDTQHLTLTQRVDRLSLTYSRGNIVVGVGRQALTWGAGLVFHPMDIFDPFSPDATDTEYKPGVDMIYGQYLFDDGSDLQLVIAPRPAYRGGNPTSSASSAAAHFHTSIGRLQTTWLLAQDHGDTTVGLGVNGPLGGATWNAEVIPTFVDGHGTYTSAILNISTAQTFFDRDATVFAEYYRNGFGLGARHYALTDLSAPLVDRLLRGQLFNTGRDYLAGGATLQWTPLFEIAPTVIANLNDHSFYGIMQTTWSLNDNLNLIAGAQLPIGPLRSEFGGLPVTGTSAPYLTQPDRFYIQLRQYF